MKILAIDTTASWAEVALSDDERLIAEYSRFTTTHSTVLLPMIENVSGGEKIDMYAVSVGPGSFTGVRIGVSTIKGLAFAGNIPCVGVSSLEAMAMNFCGVSGIIVPVIDARQSAVYTALFSSDGKRTPSRMTADERLTISELFETLSKLNKKDTPIWFTGDAYDLIINRDDCPAMTANTPVTLRHQLASGVIKAALCKWNASQDKSVFTAESLLPVYLRKSQAEQDLMMKKQEAGK